MFDTYVVGRARTEYVPYEKTVIEKRAPTDDSIRIYEEVKEKAYKSILDTLTVENNTLKCKAILYEDVANFSKVCMYKVVINGREIEGKVKASNLDLRDRHALYDLIVKDASTYIAVELMKGVLRETF